jgi:hypothetical protein
MRAHVVEWLSNTLRALCREYDFLQRGHLSFMLVEESKNIKYNTNQDQTWKPKICVQHYNPFFNHCNTTRESRGTHCHYSYTNRTTVTKIRENVWIILLLSLPHTLTSNIRWNHFFSLNVTGMRVCQFLLHIEEEFIITLRGLRGLEGWQGHKPGHLENKDCSIFFFEKEKNSLNNIAPEDLAPSFVEYPPCPLKHGNLAFRDQFKEDVKLCMYPSFVFTTP